MEKLHDMLARGSRSARAVKYRRFYTIFLVLGLGSSIFSTEDLSIRWHQVTIAGLWLAAVFFLLDFILRFISVQLPPYHTHNNIWKYRIRYLFSFQGMTDLLSIVPLILMIANRSVTSMVQVISMFWAFKLLRYTPGSMLLVRVFRNAREPLFTVFTFFIVILLVAGSSIHFLEGGVQKEHFGSIPLSLWWTVVTLTTTGYGDATPITPLGELLASVVMISGICVFALWAGILANAFAIEVRRREFLLTWDMLTTVPMFHGLDAEAIADIARVLRPCDFSRHSTIFHRGEKGECMYFIVSGEVSVSLGDNQSALLKAGTFLGEIALITGEPRNATAMTTCATQLLVLDVVDFRDIVARRPKLANALKEEAERRLQNAPT